MWANPAELAAFDDPGPALVCIAIREDRSSRALVCGLIQHHAQARGVELAQDGPTRTTDGLEILTGLIEVAGLDPEEPLGPHPIGDLLYATWAIAAAAPPSAPAL